MQLFKQTRDWLIKLYGIAIWLYPQSYRRQFGSEMIYVFSCCIEDSSNMFATVLRVGADLTSSVISQHWLQYKEYYQMNIYGIVGRNKDIVAAALLAGVVLILPWVAMQWDNNVSWTGGDFAIAAAILTVACISYAILSRLMAGGRKRMVAAGCVLMAVAIIWVQLAVGIFN